MSLNHDYVLANDTGANFRSDTNAVLERIRCTNFAAAAPTNKWPGMLHVNSTASRLQIRNPGDTAWIDFPNSLTASGEMADQVKFLNGVEFNDGTEQETAGILQVVQAVKTDTTNISSLTWQDLTGITADITPAKSSNKILIMIQLASVVKGQYYDSDHAYFKLLRDSTDICMGDAAGSRIRCTGQITRLQADDHAARDMGYCGMAFIDTPGVAVSVTYKVQVRNSSAGATIYTNRSEVDGDSSFYGRGTSSITLLEIGA